MNVTIFEMEDWKDQAFAKRAPQYDLEWRCSPPPANSLSDPTHTEAISTSVSSRLDSDVLEQPPHRKLFITSASCIDGSFMGCYGLHFGVYRHEAWLGDP